MSDKQQQSQLPKKSRKQIPQVFKDSTNIFFVQNPQVLPPLSNQSQNQLKELLHSTNISGFRTRSKNWINNISKDHKIKQMLIRIKQINKNTQLLPKYSLQLYPSFQKYSANSFISNNSIIMNQNLHNLTVDTLKQFQTKIKWNFKHSQFILGGKLKLYSPWEIQVKKKWGKPLDKRFAADQRLFGINYILNNDSRRTNINNPLQSCQSIIFWQMKGYQTRLNRLQKQMNNIYENQHLKKIDIIETGFKYNRELRGGTTKYGIKLGLGSDYYNTWYYKLKANYFTTYIFAQKVGLFSNSQIGIIDGKNVIQHQMFSRNANKWMGQRSKIYGHQRFDIIARGIKILDVLNVLPSNYLSLWASKSYQNKIKLQAEIGISLHLVSGLMARFDLSLFRMSGVKGEPKFGIKYQF